MAYPAVLLPTNGMKRGSVTLKAMLPTSNAAKYVKAMRYTGYLGIGFSGLHSLNEINEACSVGREAECTKKKYTEIGSFAGGTGFGVAGGYLAMPFCIALGVGTAGVGGLLAQ